MLEHSNVYVSLMHQIDENVYAYLMILQVGLVAVVVVAVVVGNFAFHDDVCV